MAERVQKMLAQLGIASRRQIEAWIRQKKITINGKVAQLGDKITLLDEVRLDNKRVPLNKLPAQQKCRVLLYHKKVGEICSRLKQPDRQTVFSHLPKLDSGRWVSVGRLDLNTSGLLLFTTDGELANRLMHPSYQIEREYAVRVFGSVGEVILSRLKQGVLLGSKMARFNSIRYIGGSASNRWYHVILQEGRYREVRRLWQSQGITVSRLIRIRYGNIRLPASLAQGGYMELTKQEISKLISLVER